MITDSKKLIRATIRGTIWGYISKYSAKFLVFISTTILARLLSKEDFGVAGYALVTINFIEFLQGLGLRQALIYYSNDEKQNNTAFWLGIGSSVVLFLFSFFVVSPLAGEFFHDPRAIPMTRLMSLYLPITSLSIVQSATLSKRLAFKERSMPDLVNSLSKGVVSIIFALIGFGAWSLIFGQLIGEVCSAFTYWLLSGWRPSFEFDKIFIKPLLSYGLNIFSINSMSTLLSNIDYLLIGHFLGAEVLGVYTLAFRIPELLIKQFSNILSDVIFPVFTKINEDINALRRGFLTALEYVNLITVPMSMGLIVVAKLVIGIFFGEKWLEAVPVMISISVFSLIRAMVFNTGDTYKAMGRPDLLTKINFAQTIVTVPILWWVTSQLKNVVAVAWAQVGVIFIFGAIKLIIATNILDIRFGKIIKTLSSSIFAGGVMALVVLWFLKVVVEMSIVLQLILAVILGSLVYFGFLFVFYRKTIVQFISRLIEGISRKRAKVV